MDEIKLSDYLLLCLKFQNDPTEENELAVSKMNSQLVIREYVPMKEKVMNIVKLVSSLPKDYDAPGIMGYLEMGKILYGILPYVVNLTNDISILSMTYGTCDLLIENGLVDWVLSEAAGDYERFLAMLKDTINFQNILKITETAEFFDTEKFDEWYDMMKDWKENLTPEVLHDMAAISKEGMSSIKDLETQLQKEALDQANADAQHDVKALTDFENYLKKKKEEQN